MLAAASAVFAVLSVAPTGLIALGYRWGWQLGLWSQIPWAVYDIWSGQPGFLLIAATLVPTYWLGWNHSAAGPAPVTAGESEDHAWCQVCQAPWRVRVQLMQNGAEVGTLEVCPGCGTGHDHQYVGVTPAAQQPVALSLPALARAIHRWACQRRGLVARECAFGDCPWPGLWRHAIEIPGEDGTWRYVFCRASHRRAWTAHQGGKG